MISSLGRAIRALPQDICHQYLYDRTDVKQILIECRFSRFLNYSANAVAICKIFDIKSLLTSIHMPFRPSGVRIEYHGAKIRLHKSAAGGRARSRFPPRAFRIDPIPPVVADLELIKNG
jgi:hypothetical protein